MKKKSHAQFELLEQLIIYHIIFCNSVGEWWHADVEEVVKRGTNMGLPPNMSDAHTINGKPGPLFPCSEKRKNT